MNKNLLWILFFATVCNVSHVYGQWDPDQGCVIDSDGNCLPNTIFTALPFMRIIPDARGGAMGDAGIATSADAYSNYYNPAKLAFAPSDFEVGLTFVPWLRDLGLTDVYLASLSGYKRIDDIQTFGFALTYLNFGEVTFTDVDGNEIGTGFPQELSTSLTYARKLSSKFSAGIGGKFFYSNLASGQFVGQQVQSATGFAVDISTSYNSNPDLEPGEPGKNFSWGLALTNLGSKVAYTNNTEQEQFIPTQLGLGLAYTNNVDRYNSFTFTADIKKLLVLTPVPANQELLSQEYEEYLINRQGSSISNVFRSFGDAPGGFQEELREFYFSFGAEYRYNQNLALRAGYYTEHELKGNRQYLTFGAGLSFNVFTIDISYLAPTQSISNGLDNTLRFGFIFDVGSYQNSNQ